MKKILSVLLVLCMVLSLLTACGAPADEKKVTEPSSEQETQLQTQQDTQLPTQTEETPVREISFNDADITLVTPGETFSLYDGNVPVEEVTFGTEDSKVATIENGIVTAVNAGETVVYAEHNGVRIQCRVYCNMDAPKPTETTAPKPTEPKPTEPKPTEPKPTEPKPTETKPTEPKPTETKPTEPNPTEPTETKPTPTDPTEPSSQTGSFFDDAVFVGDSISLKLSQYAASSGALGKAKFLVVGSYGVHNAINDHPDTRVTYQGKKYQDLEKAIAATGAKKLFIMFGMNDIALYGIDKTISSWGTLLGMIRSASPNITIYIQSMTPVLTGGEKTKLNNANVRTYNEKLKTFAQNNGCRYIDVHSHMTDSTGGLAKAYCSDGFVHLTNAGAKQWIAVLKAYVGE